MLDTKNVGGGMIKMKPLVVEFPTEPDPAVKTYDIDLIKFKLKYEKALRIEEEQQNGMKYAYFVYLQHCTDAMKLKLKSMQEWEDTEKNQDGIGLVKLLQLICTKKGSGPALTMLELVLVLMDLFRLWQDGRTLEV